MVEQTMRRSAQGKTWLIGGLLVAGGLWAGERAAEAELRFKTAQECRDFMAEHPVGTWYKDLGNQCLACVQQDYKWLRQIGILSAICVDAPKPGRRRTVIQPDPVVGGDIGRACRATCDPHEQWDGTYVRSTGVASSYYDCGCTWVDTPSAQPGSNAPVTSPSPNTYYYIIAKHSGKALTVHGGGQENGAYIDQWDNQHTDNQKWRFEPVGDGTYRVIVKHSGKLLTVHGGGRENGAILDQWTNGGGPNQRFSVKPASDGTVFLIPQNSGIAVTVHGGGQENGAIIDQWALGSTDNQKWQMFPAEPTK